MSPGSLCFHRLPQKYLVLSGEVMKVLLRTRRSRLIVVVVVGFQCTCALSVIFSSPSYSPSFSSTPPLQPPEPTIAITRRPLCSVVHHPYYSIPVPVLVPVLVPVPGSSSSHTDAKHAPAPVSSQKPVQAPQRRLTSHASSPPVLFNEASAHISLLKCVGNKHEISLTRLPVFPAPRRC